MSRKPARGSRARDEVRRLDVFISAVRFMEGAPARAWWHYTKERKRVLQAGAVS